MAYVRWLLGEIHGIVQINGFWMTWNLLLAFIPAALAVPLFWRPHRRTPGWWFGVGLFALFLPNAPYVLTDLIHLRLDAARSASDGVLAFGVLPIYGTFILLGMSSYVFCVAGIVREVRSARPGTNRSLIELPVHALCSLGIVLGRIARLNSWDTITEPVGTLETVFATLTWRGAPAAFFVIFAAVWLAFTVLRTLMRATGAWASEWAGRFGLPTSVPRPTT